MARMQYKIIFTIILLAGLTWAQTLSDIERYRKQYERYFRSMQEGQAGFELGEDEAIIAEAIGAKIFDGFISGGTTL